MIGDEYVTVVKVSCWKLQLENCSDAYHFTSVHPSYIRLIDRRKSELQEDAFDLGRRIYGADGENPDNPKPFRKP